MTLRAGGLVDVTDVPKIKYKKKASSETVTSSTTLQDDDDIVVTLAANTVYRLTLVAAVSGATGGDVKFAWAATGTVTSPTGRHCVGPDTSITTITATTVRASATHGLTTSVTYGTDGTGPSAIREELVVDGGASGGTITLRWAQNASSGTATTMQANTFLVIEVVEAWV